MSTYRLSSRWACSTLICCLAAATACSSPAEPSPSAAGATSGGSVSASGSSAGSSVGGSISGGGTSGSSSQGGSGGSAQAGAPGASGGTNSGGAAGSTAGGAGGVSGSAGITAAAGTSNGGSGGASTGGFALTSPAWTAMAGCAADNKAACPVFPKENIGTSIGGSNKSPALDWTAGPSGTQSYAIVLQDLSNIMGGKPFVHWAMWNIPGATRMLPAGLETTAMPNVPAGSSQRSYSGNGYQGSGKCGNVYEFVLYALPTASFTPTGTTQTAVRDGLVATNAPSATLRARSGAPGCTE